MEILGKKESKLLDRTELEVLFGDEAGSLTRKEAVKQVAREMKVDEKKVGLLSLRSGSGSRRTVGSFHVYGDEERMKTLHHGYLSVRLLTKEEKEALKQAKKKAAAP